MQRTRKTSFFRNLFGTKQRQAIEPKKPVQPLDERELTRVAGGTGETGSPKGTW